MPGILCVPGLTCNSDMKACTLEETRYLAHKYIRQTLTLQWIHVQISPEEKVKLHRLTSCWLLSLVIRSIGFGISGSTERNKRKIQSKDDTRVSTRHTFALVLDDSNDEHVISISQYSSDAPFHGIATLFAEITGNNIFPFSSLT